MTAVETLREAAKALRERAEAASPGPWEEFAGAVVMRNDRPSTYGVAYEVEGENAAYIATMHPGVALALADWLDDDFMHQYGPTEHALTVADLILGGAR